MGRPTSPGEVFEEIERNRDTSGSAKLISRKARLLGLSMAALAEAVERDPTAVARSLFAAKPRSATVGRLLRALGMHPMTVKASEGALSSDDVRGLKFQVLTECSKPPYSLQFPNFHLARTRLSAFLYPLDDAAAATILGRFLLIRDGVEEFGARPPLAPEYAFLEQVLKNDLGYGLIDWNRNLERQTAYFACVALEVAQIQLGLRRDDKRKMFDELQPVLRRVRPPGDRGRNGSQRRTLLGSHGGCKGGLGRGMAREGADLITKIHLRRA